MSEVPTTPIAIVRALGALTEKLYAHVRVYAAAEHDAAIARAAAEATQTRAFLNADGAMELRKYSAKDVAEELDGRARIAEALVRTYKAKIRAIEVDIEVHRTFAATVRSELKTLGYEGSP